MTSEEFNSYLVREFFSVVELEGRGTIAKLQREMGLSRAYFSQWKAGKVVSIPRLLEALELLGVPAARFFATALAAHGPEEPSGFGDGRFGKLLAGKKE